MEKTKLPNSQSALILGISSIITACCCFNLVGVVLGIIGLVNANKAIALYNQNPEMYTGINNANTGKTTSIIGIVIGALSLFWLLYIIYTGQFNLIMEQYQQDFGVEI